MVIIKYYACDVGEDNGAPLRTYQIRDREGAVPIIFKFPCLL